MNMKRSLLSHGLLLLALASSQVCLTYGKEDPSFVPVMRNAAWNDFVTQIRFLPEDSQEDSLDKELKIIHSFLKTHETEVSVGIYDLEVFRAIDRARARLQRADKDLETLRNELAYKEQQANSRGDL